MTEQLSTPERYTNLQASLANMPELDAYRTSYYRALQEQLIEGGPMADLSYDLLDANPNMGSSHFTTQSLRAVQHNVLQHRQDYPIAYTTPAKWHEELDGIATDDARRAAYMYDMHRRLQSTVSDRCKGLAAVAAMAWLTRRFTYDYSVADIGCSQNNGLNHLASNIAFGTPDIVRPGSTSGKLDEGYKMAFEDMLRLAVPLRRGVGVDINDIESSRSWAFSNSFNPHELLDEDRVQLFHKLINSHYDHVTFEQADYSRLSDERLAAMGDGEQFDVVHFSTMLYQLPEHEREQMLANARKQAKEFIVVQDFLEIDKNDPRHLLFRDNWHDTAWPYRTVFMDMREETPKWHEAFLWSDGRAMRMTPGLGRLAVANGGSVSVAQLMHRLVDHDMVRQLIRNGQTFQGRRSPLDPTQGNIA